MPLGEHVIVRNETARRGLQTVQQITHLLPFGPHDIVHGGQLAIPIEFIEIDTHGLEHCSSCVPVVIRIGVSRQEDLRLFQLRFRLFDLESESVAVIVGREIAGLIHLTYQLCEIGVGSFLQPNPVQRPHPSHPLKN